MDARPSELDPYPRAERDLGSVLLWERSLHRSQRRRVRQRDARRNAPRQKGATLAAGAAILASPVLTPLIGAASASSARPGVTKAEITKKATVSGEETWLLSYGDTGQAVAAAQTQMKILSDGIFGPQTEAAVKSFQEWQGLAITGVIDAKTWSKLFGTKVLFYGSGDASTSSAPTEASLNVVYGGEASETESEPVGGPDLSDRVELRSEIEQGAPPPASEPAPEAAAPEAAPETVAQSRPVSTGNGCTSDGRMVAPVNGTVTGTFGEDRGSHAHSGTDIAAPTGTTVRAAECGTVSVSGTESGYGSMVCVQHAGETTTCYAHLSERSVSVNEYVQAGQKIGEVGCTGSCTGPHVHFEVRNGGAAQDPTPYLSGSRTVAGKSVTATTAEMPAGEGGIGGATAEEQAAVHGSTGGAEAPAPAATATTQAPAPAPVEPAPVAEAPAPAPVEAAPVEAAPVAEAPAPAPVEPVVEAPAPAPVEPVVEAPAPAPVEPVVEAPAPVEPVVEAPAPVEPVVEAPAPVEPVVEAPAPAPVEPAPVEPAPAEPAPVAEAPAAEAPAPEAAAPAEADASVAATGGVAAP